MVPMANNDLEVVVVTATGPQLTRHNQSDLGYHWKTCMPTPERDPYLLLERASRTKVGHCHAQAHLDLHMGMPRYSPQAASFSKRLSLDTPLHVLQKHILVFLLLLHPFTCVPNLLLLGKRRKELNVCII